MARPSANHTTTGTPERRKMRRNAPTPVTALPTPHHDHHPTTPNPTQPTHQKEPEAHKPRPQHHGNHRHTRNTRQPPTSHGAPHYRQQPNNNTPPGTTRRHYTKQGPTTAPLTMAPTPLRSKPPQDSSTAQHRGTPNTPLWPHPDGRRATEANSRTGHPVSRHHNLNPTPTTHAGPRQQTPRPDSTAHTDHHTTATYHDQWRTVGWGAQQSGHATTHIHRPPHRVQPREASTTPSPSFPQQDVRCIPPPMKR